MKKRISALISVLLAFAIMLPTVYAYADDFTNFNCILGKRVYVYDGTAFEPTVKVKKSDGSVTLVKDVDYKVKYSNNIKSGLGKVTITGLGVYAGAEKLVTTFTIKPPKAYEPTVTGSTSSSISLKWKELSKETGITGYNVYTCDKNGENRRKVATTKSNTVTVSNLQHAKKYNFVVKAYKTVEDYTLYGEASNVHTYATRPNQGEIKQVTNAKDKKSITVTWSKRAGSGYEIKYSRNSDFSKAKVIRITDSSKTSKTISVPDASKKYYVKIRAIKEYKTGKYNYGQWSAKFSNSFSKTYSSYYSYYVNDPDRTNNLKLASKAINGTILAPGETFSFNQIVGKRTSARGYKPAHVFAGAEETVMGVGGGVCQVASTIFNAALLGNFQIVERHQHSQRVAYVPLGRDAAIYWGSQDFKFKNNTSRPVKMIMECKDGKISCTIKVCENASPKKVSLNVYTSGNTFTLKRSVNGTVNYTTTSRY